MSTPEAKSPKYRLIYYPFRGRAELVRILFAHLEIPYEDVRIELSEWVKLKPESPFGVIPILEFLETGKRMSSSITIARMFAEQFGLAGGDAVENAELFSIVDATADAWVQVYAAIYHEKDEARKALMVKSLHEVYLPDAMTKFERYASTNNAEEGWIFGNKFTYADIATYLLFEYAVENIPGALQHYPTLAKQRESVTKMENIAQWLEKRPKTAL